MERRLITRWIAVASLAAVVATGCQGQERAQPEQTPTTRATTPSPDGGDYSQAYAKLREAYGHMFPAGDNVARAIAQQKNLGDIGGDAVELRVTLDRLLGEHTLLAAFAMQRQMEGADDADEARAALEANTTELGDAIGARYGEQAQRRFLEHWRHMTGLLNDYAVATRENDAAQVTGVRDDLTALRNPLGDFLSETTGLAADRAQEFVRGHAERLTELVRQYRDEDYAGSYERLRDAYRETYGFGDALAAAIASQKNLGQTDAGASDLRLRLDRLLGEHAVLDVFAMIQMAADRPDAQALRDALGQNTSDLRGIIAEHYDQRQADAFRDRWSEHVRLLTAYAEGQADASEELSRFTTSFSEFLAELTGIRAGTAADALRRHIDQVTSAFDAHGGA